MELKAAVLGEGAKANHLTYLGDAEIGAGANIGAGTITCNYDGVNKHRTEIGEGAFIGSDTALVAPVKGRRARHRRRRQRDQQDVPDDALAVARPPVVTKEDWASRMRARQEAARAKEKSGKP